MADRILFAGGGTGGHIFMAVALVEHLRRQNPHLETLFVGTARGLEQTILPPLGLPLELIRAGALKGVGPARLAASLLQLPAAFLSSLRIVRAFRPAAVVGLGGYSSGPVVAAARLLGRPSLLIEPNVQPGLTNRLLGPLASFVAVAFEETASAFGSKGRLTGIPVRHGFFQARSPVSREGPLRLLIFGGSQGSRPINRLVSQGLASLEKGALRIVHQTGRRDYEWVCRAYREAGLEATVCPFLEDMPERFRDADLILSRAGALTVAEIAAAAKASILIPFPGAADDHQRRNAQALARRGAALVLDQKDLRAEDLAGLLGELSRQRERLVQMARASGELARPGGCERIARLLGQIERS